MRLEEKVGEVALVGVVDGLADLWIIHLAVQAILFPQFIGKFK